MNEQEKKKLAEKRKRDGEANLNKIGLSLDSELFSVGIIFDNLLKSDINENLLNGANVIFNNFVGVDLNIFSHSMDQCCVFLLAPILDLKYIFSWTYPLVVVNESTLQTALNSKSPNIYCAFPYNNTEGNIRVKVLNSLNLVEIIKVIVEDLKNEKK